jgi:hypothetical protein
LRAAVDDSDKVTWDSAFNTQSRSEVEAHCRQLGLQESWNTDGGLTVITSMHAFTDHPKTGERFYRSHIHSGGRVSAETADASETTQQRSPSGYRFENGETLTSAETATITSIFDKIECSFPWSDGDIMMLDNLQVAHGRNPFSGQREVLVALLN